jgi:hypothetical protein
MTGDESGRFGTSAAFGELIEQTRWRQLATDRFEYVVV